MKYYNTFEKIIGMGGVTGVPFGVITVQGSKPRNANEKQIQCQLTNGIFTKIRYMLGEALDFDMYTFLVVIYQLFF